MHNPSDNSFKTKRSAPTLKIIGIFSLTMLITGSIDSIRNLPSVALFGSTLLFFFVLGAILFLVPTALISAHLILMNQEEGGIYQWCKKAFGPNAGSLAIWLQWANTTVWFPTVLSFLAATLSYLINPQLAHNNTYLVSVILTVFWGLTLVNLRGLHVSTRIATWFTVVGVMLPMGFIILLGFISWATHQPSHIHLTWESSFPDLHTKENWGALTFVMASFLGMELATVHVRDIPNAKKIFPRALAFSTMLILFTMIAGCLTIASVLSPEDTSLVAGIMQTFQQLLARYHLSFLLPIIALMIVVGILGELINWLISPTRGLLQAAEDGFLPAWVCHTNRFGVANRLLLGQAVIVSLVCLAFFLVPSVNGTYWFLTDLSTQLYMLMYIMMFLAAIFISAKHPMPNAGLFKNRATVYAVSVLGLIGCIVSILVGLIPPNNISVGGAAQYELYFFVGLLCMISPVVLLIRHRRKKMRSADDHKTG